MILRVVLSVLLSTALVGVSLPAIDQAGVESSDARVQAELGHLRTAIQTLPQKTDPVHSEAMATHQTITLTLPEKTWTSAPVEYVVIEPTATGGRLRWKVEDGHEHTIFLQKASIQTPGNSTEMQLTTPGTHRLSLTLVEQRGSPVVVVRHLP